MGCGERGDAGGRGTAPVAHARVYAEAKWHHRRALSREFTDEIYVFGESL